MKIELPKARRRGANNTAKRAEIRIDSSLWTTCEATKPLPTISAIFERAWPYAGYIFNNTVQESNINEVMNRAKYANTGFVATVRRALNLLQSRLLILNCVYKRKVYWPLRDFFGEWISPSILDLCSSCRLSHLGMQAKHAQSHHGDQGVPKGRSIGLTEPSRGLGNSLFDCSHVLDYPKIRIVLW